MITTTSDPILHRTMSTKPVTKATVERLMESTGGTEREIQNATARYDCCETDKERSELLDDLKRQRGGATKGAVQTKEAKGGDSKAKTGKAPSEETK